MMRYWLKRDGGAVEQSFRAWETDLEREFPARVLVAATQKGLVWQVSLGGNRTALILDARPCQSAGVNKNELITVFVFENNRTAHQIRQEIIVAIQVAGGPPSNDWKDKIN